MKKQIWVFSVIMLLLGAVTARAADEDQGNAAASSTTAVTQNAKEVGNKICPVTGEKVGETGPVVQHEYQGKLYNFCCKMCLKDFDKDPAKYSKVAEEEASK